MTSNEAILMQFLTDNGLDLYTKDYLIKNVELSANQIETAIRNLIKKDSIIQLEKGKYCNYGFYDEYVIGCFLAHNSCVSYWTAMNYYGLTEQIPNMIFIQTDRQKRSKNVLGTPYRFIWLNPNKIFGWKSEGYSNHSFRISDKEKTIIDCFDMPHYSGGYPEIIKAFYNADLSSSKLIAYCRKMKNISLTKRLAFLADLFNKKKLEKFINYALKVRNNKFNLFEHDGEQIGKINKKWGLIMNIKEDEIYNMATA